ncbi:MAG: hypothetical protein BRD44_06485 [Bacteroidetes bacterium QS_7_67_15]|nr:MAG: hypothetical protein BRD44_06485 [Bacteroidetes bacterium QS_7_67_15]PSQ93654.1 MAG: hypothetical protein BRD52_00585 [Bacteroidetes bacterium SW_4_67_19]
MQVANSVPERLARVVSADRVRVEELERVGPPWREEVFVTAEEDLAGFLATPELLSSRLGIPLAESYWIITFAVRRVRGPVTSPVREEAQCFVGGGRTRGGAREFHIQNQPIPDSAHIRRCSR